MYLLDTNIVSELRKAKSGKADKNVTAWAASVSAESMFLSAITILELETGILLIERRDPAQGAPYLRVLQSFNYAVHFILDSAKQVFQV